MDEYWGVPSAGKIILAMLTQIGWGTRGQIGA